MGGEGGGAGRPGAGAPVNDLPRLAGAQRERQGGGRAALLLTSDRRRGTFCRNPTVAAPPPSRPPMPQLPADVLRGTLDLLVLKTLTLEPMHGWGISARIEQFSRGRLDVNQGSLYPALQRRGRRGGSRASGASPRTTAAPGTTGSPPPDGAPSAPR